MLRHLPAALLLLSSTAFAQASLEARSVAGETLTYRADNARVLLVNYWATWCAACVEEMQLLDQLYVKYHAQGLDVVGVSMDSAHEQAQVRATAARVHYPMAMQDETELNGLSRPWAVPMNYLIARNGDVVLDGKPGFTSSDGPALEQRIRQLLDAPAQGQRKR